MVTIESSEGKVVFKKGSAVMAAIPDTTSVMCLPGSKGVIKIQTITGVPITEILAEDYPYAGDMEDNMTAIMEFVAGTYVGNYLYVATLSQASTSAPVATVITNTFPEALGPVIARVGAGEYTLTFDEGVLSESEMIWMTGTVEGDEAVDFTLAGDVVTIDTVDDATPTDGILDGAKIMIFQNNNA